MSHSQSSGSSLPLSRRAAFGRFGVMVASLACVGIRPSALAAEATPPPISTSKLAEGIFMIAGAGGNILAFTGEDGLVMVDSGLANAVTGTTGALGKIAPGAPSWLINTHWHYDHVGGNERLVSKETRIVASENTRRRMSEDQYNEFFSRPMAAVPTAARPKVVITGPSKLLLNHEEIQLLTVPPAHTDGDTIVYLAGAQVMHTGDLFTNGAYPFIDYSSGGWLGGMVTQAEAMLELVNEKTQIVPGHGPLARKGDLERYAQVLGTIFERFSKAKAEGKTVEDVLAAGLTKEFDPDWGGGFLKPEAWVRCAYTSVLRRS